MSGKFYEELQVGDEFAHLPARTVTETDNLLFTTLTMNTQPLHLDEEFPKRTVHGKILMNSIFTLGLMVGLFTSDTALGTTIGNLGFDKTTFPSPVFIGDAISAPTKLIEKRESKTKTDRGIVTFEHTATNQHNDIVCLCIRTGMMARQNS